MKKKVRFQNFIDGEGWTWENCMEGVVIAETESAYKVKVGWFSSFWVEKIYCEQLLTSNTNK